MRYNTSRIILTLAVPAFAFATVRPHALAHAQSQDSTTVPSYTHYWPGSCLEAVSRTDDFYWRARPDTTRFTPARDTMLSTSARVARECVTKFSIAQVNPAHLILLARIYLSFGDDSSAQTAIRRRLDTESSKPVAVRATTLAGIITAYLQASPVRLANALATFRQLDALSGADAAVGKVAAYQSLAMYYLTVDDDSNAISASNALIAAGQQLTPRDRQEFGRSLLRGYAIQAELAGARTGSAETVAPILARAREDLGSLEPVLESLEALEETYRLYGQEGGQLTGDFWFHTTRVAGSGAGSELRDTTRDTTALVRPTPGKVSIISFQPARQNIPAYRRLQQQFGDSFELTFVLRTNGYFRDQGPLTPPEEAVVLRQYYIGELHLPGTLVISAADSKSLPDGRLIKQKSNNMLKYGGGGKGSPGTLVLDRNGVIRRIFSGWAPWTERELEQTIRNLQEP